MQFRLLGPVEVEADGTVLALPRRQQRCLLAVLLLASGRVVPYHRLAELLWGRRAAGAGASTATWPGCGRCSPRRMPPSTG